MNQTKLIPVLGLVIALSAASIFGALLVSGAITTPTPVYAVDIRCVNGGGNLPPGQQPTCKGNGLTQEFG